MLQTRFVRKLNNLTWKQIGNSGTIFNPGTKVDIDKFPLPLRNLYLVANGQKTGTPPVFLRYVFSSADAAPRDKEMLDSIAEEEKWEQGWWSPNWFPFAADPVLSDYLIIDKATGRIIEWLHDDADTSVQAESLESFLLHLISGLESGKLYFDPELGVIDSPAEVIAAQHQAARRRIDLKKLLSSLVLFRPSALHHWEGWLGFTFDLLIEILSIVIYVAIGTVGVILFHKLRSLF